MMSWESVFSLLFISVLIGFLVLVVNTYKIDTSMYEYQLANDFAETVYKTTGSYVINDKAKEVLDNLTEDSGYCVSVEDSGIEIYNTCRVKGLENGKTKNVVSVSRRVSGIPPRTVRYYVWKTP